MPTLRTRKDDREIAQLGLLESKSRLQFPKVHSLGEPQGKPVAFLDVWAKTSHHDLDGR